MAGIGESLVCVRCSILLLAIRCSAAFAVDEHEDRPLFAHDDAVGDLAVVEGEDGRPESDIDIAIGIEDVLQ